MFLVLFLALRYSRAGNLAILRYHNISLQQPQATDSSNLLKASALRDGDL